MNKFMKSIWGKMLLIILCIVFSCILVGSIGIGIGLFEAKAYSLPKNEVYLNLVQDHVIIAGRDSIYTYKDTYSADEKYINEEFSNLIYEITDVSGNVLEASVKEKPDDEQWDFTICFYNQGKYLSYDILKFGQIHESTEYVMHACIDRDFEAEDIYRLIHKAVNFGYGMKEAIYVVAFVALVLTIVCFVELMCVSGRIFGSEGIHEGPCVKIPTDIFFAIVLTIGICIGALLSDMVPGAVVDAIVIIGVAAVVYLLLFIGTCMNIAVRIKLGNIFTYTVIWFVLRKLWEVSRKLFKSAGFWLVRVPGIWKTIIVFVAGSIFELIVASRDAYILWILGKVVFGAAIIYIALMLRELQKSGKEMAEGNLDYTTDVSKLHGEFKDYGKQLNSIAEGMGNAVEQRIKSERMKTELITNVSHDIKTPLTSIINYATLISNEDTDNENIHEYSKILVKQSDRLKRLIEDLVEASKASTGNLDVQLAPCDPSVFLSQAGGEYEEKLTKANLTLIVNEPAENISIMADGRRMWRIFDNLMNNICKYAQNGTRVYLSLEEIGQNAVITFKNISKDSLNVSPEELMERFVRGDSSRNTEGNGLGLAIAKSMAELQGGTLNLVIDGDLFKAILTFPIIRSNDNGHNTALNMD